MFMVNFKLKATFWELVDFRATGAFQRTVLQPASLAPTWLTDPLTCMGADRKAGHFLGPFTCVCAAS